MEALRPADQGWRFRSLLRRARLDEFVRASDPDVRLGHRARARVGRRSGRGQEGQALGRSRGGFTTKSRGMSDPRQSRISRRQARHTGCSRRRRPPRLSPEILTRPQPDRAGLRETQRLRSKARPAPPNAQTTSQTLGVKLNAEGSRGIQGVAVALGAERQKRTLLPGRGFAKRSAHPGDRNPSDRHQGRF
jgi:hypothetical protein